MTGVYLLHFDRPVAHARHYIGWALDITARVEKHQAGRGARLVQVAIERGRSVELVRTWPGADRNDERKLKNRRNAPRLCPVCRAMRRKRR